MNAKVARTGEIGEGRSRLISGERQSRPNEHQGWRRHEGERSSGLANYRRAKSVPSEDSTAQSLLDDVNRWSADPQGRSQDDDITMVVLDFQSGRPAEV